MYIALRLVSKISILRYNEPYHDTLIKFSHDSNYDGDAFISF
jgi:hypothetical protein